MIVAPETLQLAGVIVMATVAFSLYLLHTTLQESFKRRFHKVSAYGMLFTFGMLGAYLTFFYPRAITTVYGPAVIGGCGILRTGNYG